MMLPATQDTDAIFSKAIQITSPQERDAFLTQACGTDTELRRHVEERLAAHFQAAGTPQEHPHEKPHETLPQGSPGQKYSPARVATVAGLLLAVTLCISLAVWAIREQRSAERALQQAAQAREQVQKAEEEQRHQREQAETARKTLAQERDQAVEQERATRESAEEMKAVLAFFQGKVLSAGRPVGWASGLGKEVTLRKAVDTAQTKIAQAFEDRPLAEAALRETLGSTYLDLEDAPLAVKQYERALALREALQGENSPDTVVCRNQLAIAYRLADRPKEASRLYEPTNSSSTHAAALGIRGSILLSQKKPAEAEAKLRESLAIYQKLQPDDWTTFDARSLLGKALLEQKKYAEAEPMLLEGYEGMKQRQSKMPPEDRGRLTRTMGRLMQLYDDWGKKDKAEQWRKELEAANKKEG